MTNHQTDNHLLTVDSRGVAVVTLNRPAVHNAFDDVLIASLHNTLTDLQNDQNVRLLVLTANGKSFSAGADLGWMQRMAGYSYDENFADSMRLAELMKTLFLFEKPTIAKVQGSAFGGGVGLIACCDIAVASRKANFCLSEVKLGLVPAVISPYVVKALGERQAKRYFQTAEVFPANEALRLQLLHEVVDADNLDQVVDKLIDQLLTNGPVAQGVAKKLVDTVTEHDINTEIMQLTAKTIADIRASAEGREGVAAFLGKRNPNWIN